MQYIGQRVNKLLVLFHPYLLQVMYHDISIPDSFMYILAIEYVSNISRYRTWHWW